MKRHPTRSKKMVEVTIRITAPNEEILRRAMDEIQDACVREEGEAKSLKNIGGERCVKLGERHDAVAKVLNDIADAIDTATVRKVR
jgi:hypothetical protein